MTTPSYDMDEIRRKHVTERIELDIDLPDLAFAVLSNALVEWQPCWTNRRFYPDGCPYIAAWSQDGKYRILCWLTDYQASDRKHHLASVVSNLLLDPFACAFLAAGWDLPRGMVSWFDENGNFSVPLVDP
jgi:hypothetical protein